MASQCNGTATMEFFLTGFQGLHRSRIVLFLPILLIYIMTVGANLLIVFLVSTSHLMHSPMYFFLCHLSLCDFFFSTNIVPKMMQVTLEGGSTISFSGCFIQFYVFASCTGTECYLLTAMSYDRYLAICYPLRYTSIMDLRLCVHLAVCCWFLSFFFVLITLVFISMLRFCDKNIIDHFYCDFIPILELSCTDTSAVEIETTFFAYVIVLLPFLVIVGSYFNICRTILGISSRAERKRAFSTCSSHLTIVSSYYGSLLSIYLVPSQGHSLNMNKFLSLLYTFVTPLINPIIYSLRNREIRNQCSRLFLRFRGEPLG
ncbi:olfactory receptor 6Q1-like [Spea bombifrons]|uniref:olfactory receptor 6Q1-like n=1 Tax=Spea bombifrons TaxID=233779 RepID=UPI00234B1F87|nr:olfactory receptor 6Q1-like [Spea bombifrons]